MSLFGGHDPAPVSEAASIAGSTAADTDIESLLPPSPGFPNEDSQFRDDSDFSIESFQPTSPTHRTSPSPSIAASEHDVHLQSSPPRPHTLPGTTVPQENSPDHQPSDSDASSLAQPHPSKAERIWARAWRHYTAPDRLVATSLDQVRANDLAIHLYNTHALKARPRVPAAYQHAKPWASKKSWLLRDDLTGEKPWIPTTEWSAWPLEPAAVPKGDEVFGADVDGHGHDDGLVRGMGKTTDKKSDDLEQELYAVLLRRARVLWEARSHGPAHCSYTSRRPSLAAHSPSLSRASSATRDIRSPSRESEGSRQQRRSRSRDVRSISREPTRSSSAAPEAASPSPSPSPPNSAAPSRPTSSKGAHVKDEQMQEDDLHRPVFSADDDRSHAILAPTVRHILANVDGLLAALHHHREGQHVRAKDAADASDDSAANTSGSAASTRRQQPRRSSLSSAKPTNDDVEMADAHTRSPRSHHDPLSGSDYSASTQSSPRKPRSQSSASPSSFHLRHRNHRPCLRDWSEILGIAAMTGNFSPAVIARTKQRCEALFEEKMSFRTFPSHGPFHDGILSSSDEEGHVQNPNVDKFTPKSESSHRPGIYICPFPTCKRHINPFVQGYRYRFHLKSKHKLSPSQISHYNSQLLESASTTTVSLVRRAKVLDHNPRGWVPPDPLTCEVCENEGLAATVHPKVKRLLDHMRRTHGFDPRVDEMPPSTSARHSTRKRRVLSSSVAGDDIEPGQVDDGDDESSDYEEENDDDNVMVGGVHLDGFMQLIPKHGRGRDVTKRLSRKTGEKRDKQQRKAAKRKRALIEDEDGISR